MTSHPKARLGLAGRQGLVSMIERGSSIRSAARTFHVSPATAHKWWHRHLAGEGLAERSSRPHRSTRMLDSADQERICQVRRHTGWGAHAYANFLAQVLPGGPPTASAKSSDGGTSWWPFALGGAILLVVGALLLTRRRVQSDS